MKKYLALYLAIGAILGIAVKANAEDLKVNVPFDFHVSKSALLFVTRGTGALAVVNQFDSSAVGNELVFHKIGDEYFLSDVVRPDGTMHFAPSKAERKLTAAVNQQSVTTIPGD